MEKYSALIIDLKKSRSYKQMDRIDIQNYIKSIIDSAANQRMKHQAKLQNQPSIMIQLLDAAEKAI